MTQKSVSVFDPKILAPAIGDAFKKLDPRLMVKNPVMFVTLVGAVICTVDAFRSYGQTLFVAQIAVWLWFTVLFANFAEAVAEGRGKAQARALRQTRTRTNANKLNANGLIETVDAASLRKNDMVLARAGEVIPADGRSSSARRRWTVPPLPASPRRSFVKPAATQRRHRRRTRALRRNQNPHHGQPRRSFWIA